MAEEKIVIEVEIDDNAAAQKLSQIKKEISDLRKEQNECSKAIREGNDVTGAMAAKFAENTKKLNELNAAEKDYTQIVITASKQGDNYTDSLNSMSAQLVELKKQYRSLSSDLREGATGKDLLQRITDLDEKLKGAEASMGEFHRNVGNYTGSMNDFAKTMLGSNEKVAKLAELFGVNMADGLKAGITGVKAFGKALLASPFSIILIAVKALSIVLGALKDRFQQNTKVQDQFKRTTQALQPIMDALNEVLDTILQVVGNLVEAWGEFIGKLLGTKKVTEEVEGLQETLNSCRGEILGMQSGLKGLIKQLNDTEKGSKEYSAIIEQINKQYGEYLNNIGLEAAALYRNEDAYRKLAKAIELTMQIKNLEAFQASMREKMFAPLSNALTELEKKARKVFDIDTEEGLREYKRFMSEAYKSVSTGEYFDISKFFELENIKSTEEINKYATNRARLGRELNDTVDLSRRASSMLDGINNEIKDLNIELRELGTPKGTATSEPSTASISDKPGKSGTDRREDIEKEWEEYKQQAREAGGEAWNAFVEGFSKDDTADELLRIEELFRVDPDKFRGELIDKFTEYYDVLNEEQIALLESTEAYQKALDNLSTAKTCREIEKLGEQLEMTREQIEESKSALLSKKFEEAASTIGSISDAFSTVREASSALSDAVSLDTSDIEAEYSEMGRKETQKAKFEQTMSLVSVSLSGAKASAEGIASAMKLAFPLNVIAAAGVAAQIGIMIAQVISTIKKLSVPTPAFAEGGIVPGNSYSGDKVLSRLNSGEMVLTMDQQRNLLNMISYPNEAAAAMNMRSMQDAMEGALEKMPSPVLVYKEFESYRDRRNRRSNIVNYK